MATMDQCLTALRGILGDLAANPAAAGLDRSLSCRLTDLEQVVVGRLSSGAVRDLEVTEVLPAHEWRFTGLAARAQELAEHHEHRLAELLTAVAEHPGGTPWDLAAHLTWSRPWSSYERGMRVFAVTETDAHLRLLASRGLVRTTGGPVPTWTLAVR